MKPKLLLRIAAALMLVHTVGHTFGTIGWKKAPNAEVGNVINGMENVHFKFMGRLSTIGDFYEGFCVSMILILLLMVVLLWLLSTRIQYPIVAALAVFLLLLAVTEYIYFFPFAATVSLLAGLCTGLALVRKEANA